MCLRNNGALLLFLLAAAFTTPAQAQTLISKILVTNMGPATVSEGLIRANIHVKEGQPYNRSAVDDDIRNLYGTGYFQDIRVREDRAPDGGVILTYVMEGKLN